MQKPHKPFTLKKSYKKGHIAVGISLKSDSWRGNDSVKVEASTDISLEYARAFLAELTNHLEAAEEKARAEAAKEERRREKRERDIASGRLIVFNSLRG